MMITPRKPTDDWLDDIWRHVFPWIAGVFLLISFVVIPFGSLAISAYMYLRTGQWLNISLGSVAGWHATSDWIGLNEVANWAFALWIGIPSLIVGGIGVWTHEHRETL